MNISKTIAVVLVGGRSSRMGHLTFDKHKCLLNLGQFTILSHIYTQLRLTGIKKIIFCTGFKYKKIFDYSKKKIFLHSNKILTKIKKKSNNQPEIFYSNLKTDSTTGERLMYAKNIIKNRDIVLLYGDTLLKLNIKKYIKFIKNNMKYNVVMTVSNTSEKFGVAKFKRNKLSFFSEKIISKDKWVNSGWIFIKNKFFKKIKKLNFSFEEGILTKIKRFNIGAFKNHNYYIPIDNINDLRKANNDWRNNKKIWY